MRYQQLCNPIRYYEGDTVTFGDDSKGKIVGIGNIKLGSSSMIENVALVDGLKHNLLSVSQLCDKGFNMIFDAVSYTHLTLPTKRIV